MSDSQKAEYNKKFIMRYAMIQHPAITAEELKVFTNNEVFIKGVLAFRSAFPDYMIDTEDITAEGDFVIVHGVFKGTHEGDFHGIPATFRRVVFPTMVKYQILEDKIVNAWPMYDQLDFFEQLGVVHKP